MGFISMPFLHCRQLEENINKWTLELEDMEKQFLNQATQVTYLLLQIELRRTSNGPHKAENFEELSELGTVKHLHR